jgi:aspartyl-tRNA(Asn)/glutamyl-tRNA(Gln) amidotransferase subunit A
MGVVSQPANGPPRTIRALAASYRSGSASPVEVVGNMLKRIEALNPSFNAFITVLASSALDEARRSEERLRSGTPLGPLDGVPIAVKDIIYIAGVRCTAGSKILGAHVAPYDAPVVRRLKAAGAVLIGTTNLHEFAAGVTSDNPHYGPVRNPWDLGRVAGGSSGGSAVAVATGMSSGALGTDTAGSVRIPAALCGTVGLKPTYGRVSRLGVIPLASSLDTVGSIDSCAWDAAAVLGVIAGHDDGDLSTVDSEVPDYVADAEQPLGRARVGVPRKYFHDLVDQGIEDVFASFLGRLEEVGCRVEDAELDGVEDACRAWLPVRRAEATAFHLHWLDTSPELYGEDVRNLLERGREVSAVDYVSAVTARPGLMQRFAESIADFDAMVVPTTSALAPPLGENEVEIGGRKVEVYSALNRLTLPFNLVGFPALSIPAGIARGLPVGVQLVSRAFEESKILRLAHGYESKFGSFPLPETPQVPGTGK